MSVSLIGCGHWGKNLFRNFYDLGELDFFSDVRDETAKAFSEKFGVKCLSQKEILNSDSAAIAIATPANTHYKLAKKSLLSGKHIFVEKPLAMSVREVDDLINISSKKNLHIMIGHLLHYRLGIKPRILERRALRGLQGHNYKRRGSAPPLLHSNPARSSS